LADEIDRDRTKTETWTAFVLEIAGAGGQAAKELKPVKEISDAIGSLFGKVKDLSDEMRQLPALTPRGRIEGPAKAAPPRTPSWDAPKSDGAPDDEIPFWTKSTMTDQRDYGSINMPAIVVHRKAPPG
jgi:hypothetical protein